MAELVRLIRWDSPDYPVMGIQIKNLAGMLHSPQEQFVQIDTGFVGALLISHALFDQLNLARWEVNKSDSIYGSTVTGERFPFRSAKVDILIPQTGLSFRAMAHTFFGNQRLLLGRAFLKQHKLILDGPANLTCLMMPT